MCGIAGALSLTGAFRVTEPYLGAMCDAMAHRGPDGAGAWISADGRVGLGHRRLAIVDLSDSAGQPMGTEDGKVWLTYNGEIYNHVEIRRELEATGQHRFRTHHSDTEVVLRAYLEWGRACLARFRGMFAFAIWDARSRELWLARDRVGVKPLYFSKYHGRFTFASEIKALLCDRRIPRRINETSVFHYLSFLTAPAPDTMFDGIHKLPSGSWMLVGADGKVVEKRYWDALDNVQPLTGVNDEEIAERVLDEFQESVQLRMRSDVPVGVFLSGGIDSSANAALFSHGATAPVRTFSIGYDKEYPSYTNELDYAREVARRVGADYRELRLTQSDLIEFLPRMVALQDEPIADPVCVPLYYVSKLARDNGVTVCQLGEGADELFWGYPNWRRAWRAQRLNDRFSVPNGVRRMGLAALRIAGKRDHQPYDWLSRAAEDLPIFWGGAEHFAASEKNRLLSARLRQVFRGRSSWEVIEPIWRRFRARAWEPAATVHWMSYLDLNYRLPELLLMRVDKMSMGVGLEGRVPFLDHRLVELAMGIPESALTRGGTLKHMLKLAVRDIVPSRIIARPKQGFGVPVHEWLLAGLGDYLRSAIEVFLKETDILDPTEVRRFLNAGANVKSWNLLNLALWWREYIA